MDPNQRSAFVHEPRRTLSPKARAERFAACGGRCSMCDRKLGPADRWDVDHTIALAAGGTNDASNLRVVCAWCHDLKSRADTAIAAKGKRRAIKATVPSEFRKKSRPMAGTKASGVRKRMNGLVEVR